MRTLVPAVHGVLLVAVQAVGEAHLCLATGADEHGAALAQRRLKGAARHDADAQPQDDVPQQRHDDADGGGEGDGAHGEQAAEGGQERQVAGACGGGAAGGGGGRWHGCMAQVTCSARGGARARGSKQYCKAVGQAVGQTAPAGARSGGHRLHACSAEGPRMPDMLHSLCPQPWSLLHRYHQHSPSGYSP